MTKLGWDFIGKHVRIRVGVLFALNLKLHRLLFADILNQNTVTRFSFLFESDVGFMSLENLLLIDFCQLMQPTVTY